MKSLLFVLIIALASCSSQSGDRQPTQVRAKLQSLTPISGYKRIEMKYIDRMYNVGDTLVVGYGYNTQAYKILKLGQ